MSAPALSAAARRAGDRSVGDDQLSATRPGQRDVEQPDRATAGDYHPVAAGHDCFVLPADHAGERLEQRGSVGRYLRTESDDIAMLDGCCWYHHLGGEPAVEGDAQRLSPRTEVLVAAEAEPAPAATDIGCDEDRVSNPDGYPGGCAISDFADHANDFVPGHPVGHAGVGGVGALDDADVGAAHAGAGDVDPDFSGAELPDRTVLDLEVVGAPVDQGLNGHSPSPEFTCQGGTVMVSASLTRAVRFSSSETVPARTRATAWVPAAVPTRTGAPSITSMNSAISRAYASANRSRHERKTGDLAVPGPRSHRGEPGWPGGADLEQPGRPDDLDSGVVAVVGWADSGDDSDGAGTEGDGGGKRVVEMRGGDASFRAFEVSDADGDVDGLVVGEPGHGVEVVAGDLGEHAVRRADVVRPGRGRPGPWVSDLMIIGVPISPP